ncbi:MAG: LacI family DNA-binding transcriptional regulator [Verrucomicrobia bacterium]|nr:LacI family DNA-binding transcriptional regulator [Verrucomicrobiota bacterium]MCH8528204.1 LacI family DNA-binding transcriptional regulator [Kiritimatiellia bacterium]
MKAHSLKTIADIAGVTRTTVSLSLHNNPRISESTRKRIQRIARDLGYRPNAEISRVMGAIRKTSAVQQVLAWVVDGEPEEACLGAFRQTAQSLGYRLDVFRIDAPPLSAKRIGEILFARNIQGVIFTTPHHPDFMDGVDISSFCACAFGMRSHRVHRVDRVENDIGWCARETVRLLDQMIRFHEIGHPQIAKRISPCAA